MGNVLLTGTEGTGIIGPVVGEILEGATQVLSFITENQYLSIFFLAGLVGIAIGVIKRLK